MWRGYLFNRFLLSSEHMCSNTSLENMWVGEFGLGSLPDGTLHSPHHKTISRGLTELPAPPSLYQRPRNVHMITPFPQTSFLLSFASRKHVGRRVWPEWRKKKKNKKWEGRAKLQKENVEEMRLGVASGGCNIAASKLAPIKGMDTFAHGPRAPKPSWFCPIFQQQLCTSAAGLLRNILPVPSCCSYSTGRCLQIAQPCKLQQHLEDREDFWFYEAPNPHFLGLLLTIKHSED